MLQLLSRYKGIVVVGVLLLMPLVLLYAQTKRPGARGPIVGVVVDVAAGLERALLWVTGGILDGMEHYLTSVAAWDELVALRRERGLAVAWWARAEELEHENDELRALARAVAPIDGPRPIAARVVARTGEPLSDLITIDVGAADGVRRGDGVIDKAGVVGVVLSVGRRASDVLLLTDSRSAVDVVVQRTRARGILRGSGSQDRYGASVEDFDKLRDVKPGDAVVTSGLGARFPPGLLVGTVLETSSPDDDLYLEAEIRPAAAFDRVEHVMVLIDRPPPRAPRLGEEAAEDDVDAGPSD
ncbi:MAG: rod shape-determining protein MreC, partial [Deltaproteobacteria bacterium RBG_16_71_12]